MHCYMEIAPMRGVSLKIYLLTLAATISVVSQPINAEPSGTALPERVLHMLQEDGAAQFLPIAISGDPIIDARLNGVAYNVYFICDNGQNCIAMTFRGEVEESPSWERVDEIRKTFPEAEITEDMNGSLEFEVVVYLDTLVSDDSGMHRASFKYKRSDETVGSFGEIYARWTHLIGMIGG